MDRTASLVASHVESDKRDARHSESTPMFLHNRVFAAPVRDRCAVAVWAAVAGGARTHRTACTCSGVSWMASAILWCRAVTSLAALAALPLPLLPLLPPLTALTDCGRDEEALPITACTSRRLFQ